MNKRISATLIIAVLLFIPFLIPITKADSPVNIISHSAYIGATGNYYIVGEVQNVGAEALKYVKITATYYSANGTMLGTEYTYTELHILNPNTKSPFSIIYLESSIIPEIDHYSLAVSSYDSASSLPEGLKILSNSSYVSLTGSIHVVGEIQNLGIVTARSVKIIATFYDSTGKVVAEGDTYADPDDIAASQQSPFDLILFDQTRNPLISSYVLTAESIEYALQTEDSPIPPTIANFNLLFGVNDVKVIYPSDNATSKPLDCGAAMVSDWLASMAVSTKLNNFTEGLDTEAEFVNQTTGEAMGLAGTGVVSFGGPFVNPVVRYAESAPHTSADCAPIRFLDEVFYPYFRFVESDGTEIPDAVLPVSVINNNQDMFVIEVYRDTDGRNFMLCYGFGWKGTYAAGKYFGQIIYPNLYAYNYSWIIVKWDDANGNGFVNNPADGDTYTIISFG